MNESKIIKLGDVWYRLLRQLTHGQICWVWQAEESSSLKGNEVTYDFLQQAQPAYQPREATAGAKLVALKVPKDLADTDRVRAFQREKFLLERLKKVRAKAACVELIDASKGDGSQDKQPYLIVEWAKGRHLSEEQPLSLISAVALAEKLVVAMRELASQDNKYLTDGFKDDSFFWDKESSELLIVDWNVISSTAEDFYGETLPRLAGLVAYALTKENGFMEQSITNYVSGKFNFGLQQWLLKLRQPKVMYAPTPNKDNILTTCRDIQQEIEELKKILLEVTLDETKLTPEQGLIHLTRTNTPLAEEAQQVMSLLQNWLEQQDSAKLRLELVSGLMSWAKARYPQEIFPETAYRFLTQLEPMKRDEQVTFLKILVALTKENLVQAAYLLQTELSSYKGSTIYNNLWAEMELLQAFDLAHQVSQTPSPTLEAWYYSWNNLQAHWQPQNFSQYQAKYDQQKRQLVAKFAGFGLGNEVKPLLEQLRGVKQAQTETELSQKLASIEQLATTISNSLVEGNDQETVWSLLQSVKQTVTSLPNHQAAIAELKTKLEAIEATRTDSRLSQETLKPLIKQSAEYAIASSSKLIEDGLKQEIVKNVREGIRQVQNQGDGSISELLAQLKKTLPEELPRQLMAMQKLLEEAEDKNKQVLAELKKLALSQSPLDETKLKELTTQLDKIQQEIIQHSPDPQLLQSILATSTDVLKTQKRMEELLETLPKSKAETQRKRLHTLITQIDSCPRIDTTNQSNQIYHSWLEIAEILAMDSYPDLKDELKKQLSKTLNYFYAFGAKKKRIELLKDFKNLYEKIAYRLEMTTEKF